MLKVICLYIVYVFHKHLLFILHSLSTFFKFWKYDLPDLGYASLRVYETLFTLVQKGKSFPL